MEILENLLCVGKRKLVTKTRTESNCWCSKTGLPLNARRLSCCKKVFAEINTRRDNVDNVILNDVLIRRGLNDDERRRKDHKMVKS